MHDFDSHEHPSNEDLADYIAGSMSGSKKTTIEEHLNDCYKCFDIIVSAYDSVHQNDKIIKNKKSGLNNMIWEKYPYLLLSISTFLLSFVWPRYFIQLLLICALCGIKWMIDSGSTKILIMIYDAWKRDDRAGISKIMKTIDHKNKNDNNDA